MKPTKIITTFLAIAASCMLTAQEKETAFPQDAALTSILKDQPFLRNMGQWAPGILFSSSFGNGSARFLENGVSFCTSRNIGEKDPQESMLSPQNIQREGLVWNMQFLNSSPGAKIRTVNETAGIHNFLYGAAADKQFVHVPQCEELVYENIYRQTDIRYYRNDGGLKYDVILHPGFDLQETELAYDGIQKLNILENGNLEITHDWGSYQELKPYSYQVIGGRKKEVRVEYVLRSDKSFGFRVVGNYDRDYDVVIDPFIYVWGTYIGSTGPNIMQNNFSWSIAIDNTGSVYICGYSDASYPITSGAYQGLLDCFVTRLAPNASSIIYSTVFGGSNIDIALAIDVDNAQYPYITGQTLSANFPTTPGAFQPGPCQVTAGFVAKLDISGTFFAYSTLLDGQNTDWGTGISVNKTTGKAYVTGVTGSPNFPVTPGVYQGTYNGNGDAFVTELDVIGSSLSFSTFLGGSMNDQGQGIMLSSSGDVFVAGATSSTNFPTTPGVYQSTFGGGSSDAFVTRLNLGGTALIYSSYLGRTGDDIGWDIDVNSALEAFVTGYTNGNFPVTANAIQPLFGGGSNDAFAGKFKTSGNNLWYMTYLGGSSSDLGYGIAVNPAGEAFVSGVTYSSNFPVTVNTLDPTLSGSNDIFVSHIIRDGGSFACGGSTYIGGSDQDQGMPKIAVDPNSGSNVVVNGTTNSVDFPTTPGVVCPAQLNPGFSDQAVFKLKAKCGTRYGSFDTPESQNTLTVFPNPASDNATVNFTVTADGPATVMVYNMQGQPVQILFDGIAEKGNVYSLELLMTGLPAGAYFIEVISEQWTGRRMIVRVE